MSDSAFAGAESDAYACSSPRYRLLCLCLVLIFAPVALVALANAPGLYTYDSFIQLEQARTGVYYDWHPPIMAGLWAALIALTGQFSALFWTHLAWLSGGLTIWAIVFWRARLWSAMLLLTLFAWSPFLLTYAGVVWKDVGMAYSLIVAFGIVTLAQQVGAQQTRGVRGQFLAWGLALPFVLYAAGVRHNALVAILPLVFLAVWGVRQSRTWMWLSAAGLAAVTTAVALAAAVNWLSYDYLGARKEFPLQFTPMYDLAGISVRSGAEVIPPLAQGDMFSLEHVREAYRPYTGDYLFARHILRGTRDHEQVKELDSIWLAAIVAHPGAYLQHRCDVFLSLLRLGEPGNYLITVDRQESLKELVQHGETVSKFRLSKWAGRILDSMIKFAERRTFVFYGWFWIAVLMLVTLTGGVMLWRNVGDPLFSRTIVALGVSGIFYLIPYFFTVPACDFRYLYWCVIAASLGGIMILGVFGQLIVFRQRFGTGNRLFTPEKFDGVQK